MKWIQTHRLYLAWVIALVAVFGSLYYGEVLRFEPCRLCWYQRIAMFPLAFFLGIAFYKEESKLARYCLPLVAVGAFFAFYQSMSQLFPSLQIAGLCGESAVCTAAGWAPYLSFLGFTAIGTLILKNKF
ncbi:MAG: disulfide bond formation protein B [Verrucomicrobia bacterium]|nr:disulfide bond formation protein B [Verrucomicrobiota bacterium]MBU6446051.1 disulfide bond formation protein B [Verrucomicrobiota bacterium]MDE3046952.1 disulfide bond formation protein B [Verrucomicrobiota bacterium]